MSGREPEVGWRAFYYEANRKNKRFIERGEQATEVQYERKEGRGQKEINRLGKGQEEVRKAYEEFMNNTYKAYGEPATTTLVAPDRQ